MPFSVDQPVFETQWIVGPVRPRVRSQDTLPIVRMQHADEEVARGKPFGGCVPEQRFDLWAREDVGARLVERVDVDDERQLLDERLVAPSDIVVADRVDRRRQSATAALVHADWIDSAPLPALPHPRDRVLAAEPAGFGSAAENHASSQNPYHFDPARSVLC